MYSSGNVLLLLLLLLLLLVLLLLLLLLLHRGGKSGRKLVTEFDSYSDDGGSAVIGVQHIEVANLGARW